jgi:hypothetical protein
MATANIMEVSRVNKLIGMIGRRGLQVHAMIQQAAVQCVAHSIMYGNVTPGNQLCDALTNGARKDALVKYLETFGCFAYVKADKKLHHLKRESIEWTEEYAKKVADFDWSKAKKAPEPSSVYDVEDALEKLIDNAHRAIKQGKTIKGSEILGPLEETLTALHVKQYEAGRIQREALRRNVDEEKEPTPAPTESTVTTGTEEPATV